jgi:transposase
LFWIEERTETRKRIKVFLKQFIYGNDFALIDLTHVFSLSENVISSVPGYNSKGEFLPQIHMIFLFSLDHHMPSYFRIVAGSIRDVSSLVLTVKEAGIKNVVLITDKGFYSEAIIYGKAEWR